METQKIANLLNDSNNESSKFATRKRYIINDQNNGQYGRGNAPFKRYVTHVNDEHVEIAANLDIIMPMYNLIE